MAIKGKLCRNPFSTIKLPHEDGGSKAELWPRPPVFPRERTIFPLGNLDLLLRAQALCIQKALERRVIRVGGRENGRSAMNK
ncbi:MAG: hypothetical protein E5X76_14375 [Mesorhizobium sp.]|uniref:hypothetical protein n=1 Tax=Mesorhizobium sp. TaxID=1871066 RepID=UPI00122B5328|nr:hypothetical protein [Mesorhizobium sp.]TIP01402.1 MAG: hypothetical protein E5X72_25515 [Mesorhizobium sp.]TJV71614.1 MAG: hypothetical protein E5X76_14375 [Mesorhizobium sp.]